MGLARGARNVQFLMFNVEWRSPILAFNIHHLTLNIKRII